MSGEIEFIEVPITNGFEHSITIGTVKIRKDKIPSHRNWCLSASYKVLKAEKGETTEFEILEFGLIAI